MPGAELVEIEGADHGAHLTHPVEVARWARRAVDLVGEERSAPRAGGADSLSG